MSRSTKFYVGAALVLVIFPLLVGVLSSASSAIVAILLIGVGGYGFAVCLLAISFWQRFRYGTWPVDPVNLDDVSAGLRQTGARGAGSEKLRPSSSGQPSGAELADEAPFQRIERI